MTLVRRMTLVWTWFAERGALYLILYVCLSIVATFGVLAGSPNQLGVRTVEIVVEIVTAVVTVVGILFFLLTGAIYVCALPMGRERGIER